MYTRPLRQRQEVGIQEKRLGPTATRRSLLARSPIAASSILASTTSRDYATDEERDQAIPPDYSLDARDYVDVTVQIVLEPEKQRVY